MPNFKGNGAIFAVLRGPVLADVANLFLDGFGLRPLGYSFGDDAASSFLQILEHAGCQIYAICILVRMPLQ